MSSYVYDYSRPVLCIFLKLKQNKLLTALWATAVYLFKINIKRSLFFNSIQAQERIVNTKIAAIIKQQRLDVYLFL